MERDLCSWVLLHLSEYIDQEMQGDVCAQLEAHILECPSCRLLHQNLNGTVGMVHDLAERTIPQECLNRIRERLFKGRESA